MRAKTSKEAEEADGDGGKLREKMTGEREGKPLPRPRIFLTYDSSSGVRGGGR